MAYIHINPVVRTAEGGEGDWWSAAPLAGAVEDKPMAAPAQAQPNYGDAIAKVESGGNYRAVGPTTGNGDRALGKYQIMSKNVGPWSKEVLGEEITPTQFMASPDLQDKIFQAKFGSYVDKYGPEGASKAWFAGEKGMNNPNAKDVLGTSVSGYASKFMNALGPGTAQAAPSDIIPQGKQPKVTSAPIDDNSWWQNAPVAKPSFGDRFAGSQPAPSAPDGLQTGLQNTAAQMTRGPELPPGSQMLLQHQNLLSGASQGTDPNISQQQKNLISTEAFQDETGNVLYRDPATGQVVPADKSKHVVLRDPADNTVKVYARTDATNEGALTGISRVLAPGLASSAPTARPGMAIPQAIPALRPGQEVAQAGQRLGIDVPRAIASDRMAVQRAGQAVRNMPIIGDAIPKATHALSENLGKAVSTLADDFGAGSGPNVASRIGRNIQGAAESEAGAAANAARRSDDAVNASWQNNQEAALANIQSREMAAHSSAQRAVGSMSPQDMGATLIDRLRAGEKEARQLKERLYGVAGASDGSIASGAVREVRGRVAQVLEDAGTVIDPSITAASSKMMDVLDRLSNLKIPNKAVGARIASSGDSDIAAVNMQGIEQARKQLNFFSGAATNDADRRAAGQIKKAFDDWLSHSFDNALFSGSDEALNAYREARAANTNWRTSFGFNQRDDADRVVNQIVTGTVTPQEVSNWIVGASKVGSKGVSSRLIERITEATGGDKEALSSIRGGVWSRLTSATEGVEQKPASKIINDIHEFLNGSGRDVAKRLFSPDEQRIMGAYADTLRFGAQARNIVADVGANTKPSAMEVGIGPMQKLAAAVLGRNGKPDEALFSAIDAYAKSGGKGDIFTLSRIVKAIPEADKGDLAAAIIRKTGVSPRTGEFSPDVFASQWKSYTPQAKAILFGNAGTQRQALDDILTISERLKQVGNRFGNPSGTAQNVNLAALTAAVWAAPLSAITAAVGGSVAAKILASPAGAASAAQWTRSYAAFANLQNARTIAALQIASRNLANTANGLGVNVSPDSFLRAIQSPMKSAADQEQPAVPGRPGQ